MHSKLFDAVNINSKIQYLKLFNLFSNNFLHPNLIDQNGISYKILILKKEYIEAVKKQKMEIDILFMKNARFQIVYGL